MSKPPLKFPLSAKTLRVLANPLKAKVLLKKSFKYVRISFTKDVHIFIKKASELLNTC